MEKAGDGALFRAGRGGRFVPAIYGRRRAGQWLAPRSEDRRVETSGVRSSVVTHSGGRCGGPPPLEGVGPHEERVGPRGKLSPPKQKDNAPTN